MTTSPLDPEGLAAARRMAQWELGDPSWAEVILHAYRHPEEANRRLDEEGAD